MIFGRLVSRSILMLCRKLSSVPHNHVLRVTSKPQRGLGSLRASVHLNTEAPPEI